MISKGKQPTAAELKWRGVVADWAGQSFWLGAKFGMHCSNPYHFEIDHILGAQAKRKVNFASEKVGEWSILALPYEIHNIKSAHPLNRTLSPNAFRNEFGHEKILFGSMIFYMKRDGVEIPFSDEIVTAIVEG